MHQGNINSSPLCGKLLWNTYLLELMMHSRMSIWIVFASLCVPLYSHFLKNNLELRYCSCWYSAMERWEENIHMLPCFVSDVLLVFPLWKNFHLICSQASAAGYSDPFWTRYSSNKHVSINMKAPSGFLFDFICLLLFFLLEFAWVSINSYLFAPSN